MQIQNTKASRYPSSINRKATKRRKVRQDKNGGQQAGTNTVGVPGIGLHLLGTVLRSRPLFEFAMLTGRNIGGDQGLLQMIDTEEKQLQAIEDLYKIVRAQPKYKNLKEPSWKVDTNPIQVLLWLLRKLGPLAKGEQWTIDTYRQGGKIRYRFVVYKDYYRQHVANSKEYLPLDYLPALRDRDKPLHDMIIDLVALVSRENRIPLWDEDGDYSEALKDLLKTGKSGSIGIRALQAQALSYSKGPAAKYLKHIKRRRKVVTARIIKDRLKKYDVNSERKRYMIWWIKQGLAVAETKKCITGNSFVPNYATGHPITPWRQYKFIWSLHQNDVLNTRALNKLRKDSKDGDYYPMMFSIVKPGEVLKPLEHDDFPSLLYKFLNYGRRMTTTWHREYYYKKSLEAQETPAETLLERIEWDEFVNTVL